VTLGIVAADGFHAVSIDRVARAAGITRPIVYEHFHDLQGLLRALLDREGARAEAQVSALLPPTMGAGEVEDKLLSTLSAYLDAVAAEPVRWRLMLMPPEGAPAFLRTRVDETRAIVVARLSDFLEQSAGVLSSPDPLLMASSLEALAVHWARLLLTDPQRFGAARLLAGARWAIRRVSASS
jgi:AcrR family transcriptional regulator